MTSRDWNLIWKNTKPIPVEGEPGNRASPHYQEGSRHQMGVDVFPTPELAFKHMIQRWEEWVSDVSPIMPMLYNEYWCAKETWILSIVKDLLRRGLRAILGVHLDQIRVSHPLNSYAYRDCRRNFSSYILPPLRLWRSLGSG